MKDGYEGLRVFRSRYENGVVIIMVSREFEGERWGMEFSLEELEWVLKEARAKAAS